MSGLSACVSLLIYIIYKSKSAPAYAPVAIKELVSGINQTFILTEERIFPMN